MQAYPKSVRLRRSAEYRRAMDQGVKVVCPMVVLFGQPRADGASGSGVRFGIVASKKVGGAVTRNKIKRRLREAFRHVRKDLDAIPALAAVDLVVLARHTAANASTQEMTSGLLGCAKRLAKALAAPAKGRDQTRGPE